LSISCTGERAKNQTRKEHKAYRVFFLTDTKIMLILPVVNLILYSFIHLWLEHCKYYCKTDIVSAVYVSLGCLFALHYLHMNKRTRNCWFGWYIIHQRKKSSVKCPCQTGTFHYIKAVLSNTNFIWLGSKLNWKSQFTLEFSCSPYWHKLISFYPVAVNIALSDWVCLFICCLQINAKRKVKSTPSRFMLLSALLLLHLTCLVWLDYCKIILVVKIYYVYRHLWN
jgi:hypothetical protein